MSRASIATFPLAAVCLVASGWTHGQSLPDADAIIERYIEASGGRAAHEAVEYRVTVGTLAIPTMDLKGGFEFIQEPPNSRHVLKIDGFGEVVTGVIEEGAWRMSVFDGPHVMKGSEEFDARHHGALDGLLSWREWFQSGRTVREEDVNGDLAYVVRFVSPEGSAAGFSFGKESGLLLRVERSRETLLLSEYKDVDGVLLPHKIAVERSAIPVPFELTIESIRHNAAIPDGVFDVPKDVLAAASNEGSKSKK